MNSSSNPSQGELFGDSLEELTQRSPYIVEQLEVYNWGPFQGLHRAHFDPHGTAIIGQTGSGKTTLVDAFMTLIAERPLYNLASTGGHESDRDLISYIRGVSGEGNETGDNAHIARNGSTVTALGARFSDGKQQVTLAGLFWIEGSSSSMVDLKRLWIFSRHAQQAEQGVAFWLELHREGGVKAVKQMIREQSDTNFHDSKKAYLAQLRRFFEVGENAFNLLNRAAGLKQLNSIDTLFRELVLEDKSTFKRAADVVEGFNVLQEIRSELEIARAQQKSLLPIEIEERNHKKKFTNLERLTKLKVILPIWFASQGHTLWKQKQASLSRDLSLCEYQVEEQTSMADRLELLVEENHRIYIEQGGGSIEKLEQEITLQTKLQQNIQRNAKDYLQLISLLNFDITPSASALEDNRQRGQMMRVVFERDLEQLDLDRDKQSGALFTVKEQQESLQQEIKNAHEHANSNIDSRYIGFRRELAEALEIVPNRLAFVAELVEVKKNQSAWRGAIERALGSHRLRLIVPADHMKKALQWVSQRDNQLHVRLLDTAHYAKHARFLEDGFTQKINFRKHPLRDVTKTFIADLDRHCVNNSDELHQTPQAMTLEGLMSGSKGKFDKQDQIGLNKGWMTGFDNRDRLKQLERELLQNSEDVEQQQQQFTQIKSQCQTLDQQIQLLLKLDELEFSEIDVHAVEVSLSRLRQQLEVLQDPDSDTAQAKQAWQESKQQRQQCHAHLLKIQADKILLENELKRAVDKIDRLFKRISSKLSQDQLTLGKDQFGSLEFERIEQLDELERDATTRLQKELNTFSNALSNSIQRLIRMMEVAQRRDTGALAEVGTEIRDIPSYLKQLKTLTKEALPEKIERFLEYLNKSSDEGVTQLLSNINNEVSIIEERIEELNHTMIKVDFQPGHYLQLQPRQVKHETLTSIHKAQRDLRSAALKDDQGESHYRALVELVNQLRDAVERKKTVGAKALLDPRYRLQFFVRVIQREGDKVIEVRTGSQGGSGGEKEIITSYILTASLSYALCPVGVGRPLFGTVVLDEAFSKSSQAVAARIIEALRQFGLHPLFITPNKEMRLLRMHTRSAVLVHRRGQRASTTSLSWEELDQQAKKRLEQAGENP